VNSDADVQKALENVALYQIDAEKGEGKTLADTFMVRAYPTFVLANSEGQTIDRWLGYSKEFFIETMGSATADLNIIEAKQARFLESPDAGTAEALGRYNAATFKFKDAVDYYRQAQSLKTDPQADYTYEIFDNMAETARDTAFAYGEIAQAADAAIVAGNAEPMRVIDIASRMAQIANGNKRSDDVGRYLQAGLDATAGKDDVDLKRKHNELMVDFSILVKNDTASAVEFKRATMPEGWLNDQAQLNQFAWWCFENNINLDEAERLSRKSIELAKPGREKANNLDTLAEIMHAKGNTREALDLSKKALKEDPDGKHWVRQIERFEKILKEKRTI
jgi:tetratricopeptide (TPR) repeat protein